jgi:hypothetical protein
MKLISYDSDTIGAIILLNLLCEIGYDSIEHFQRENGLDDDGIFGPNSYNVLYAKLLNVVPVKFDGHYFKLSHEKKQIIWHHSAGWDDARNMFAWWIADGRTHVATPVGITDNGDLYKGYDEEYWAASIGCSADVFKKFGVKLEYRKNLKGEFYVANNEMLDERSVTVEVCNWGSLTKQGDKFLSWSNAVVPTAKVTQLEYKSQKYFEAYTDAEIKTLKYWTLLNAIRFDIDITYHEEQMWQVSKKALMGEGGLYTHNSYRWDKNDVCPQAKLVEMAKSLSDYLK